MAVSSNSIKAWFKPVAMSWRWAKREVSALKKEFADFRNRWAPDKNVHAAQWGDQVKEEALIAMMCGTVAMFLACSLLKTDGAFSGVVRHIWENRMIPLTDGQPTPWPDAVAAAKFFVSALFSVFALAAGREARKDFVVYKQELLSKPKSRHLCALQASPIMRLLAQVVSRNGGSRRGPGCRL